MKTTKVKRQHNGVKVTFTKKQISEYQIHYYFLSWKIVHWTLNNQGSVYDRQKLVHTFDELKEAFDYVIETTFKA